jgi:hypothetical protein
VSSNPTHDDLYSIQHYVIKFVSDLWKVGGFLRVLWTLLYYLPNVYYFAFATFIWEGVV